MSLTESIRMALRSLTANKLRASLTMLGIIIGTGAVIALLSVGQGAQAEITGQIQSIGSNLVFIFAGSVSQEGGGMGGRQGSLTRVAPLTLQDAAAIADAERSPHVAGVAPEVDRSATITHGRDSVVRSVVGTTPDYETVRSFPAQYGTFFTSADDTARARVVVIGAQTALDFFGDPEAALDQTLRINRVPFKVIGVLEEKGGSGFGGGSRDSTIIIPLSTALGTLFSSRTTGSSDQSVDLISVSAVDEASIDAAMDEITEVLRERHDVEFEEDDFTVTSQRDILKVFDQITNVLTIFLGAIAGISLLVGGIGIMNIMLVSVTERTREIGIRKALGGRRSDILWQFLIESVVLSVVGGLIGIGFGWLIAYLVTVIGKFTTFVSPQAVAIAVSFSVAVGLFFGIYPASRAANLHPIEALRYE